MAQALGTSTPTSTTVVATSTCVAPERKRSIAASFSSGAMRPVRRSISTPGSTLSRSHATVETADRSFGDAEVSPSGTSSSPVPSSTSGQMT